MLVMLIRGMDNNTDIVISGLNSMYGQTAESPGKVTMVWGSFPGSQGAFLPHHWISLWRPTVPLPLIIWPNCSRNGRRDDIISGSITPRKIAVAKCGQAMNSCNDVS